MSLPKTIIFLAYPSIEATKEEIQTFGKVATDALLKFATKKEADRTFGIHVVDKKFHIGDKPTVIRDNDIIVDGEEYEGTPGFWQLVMLNNPENFTSEDFFNYGRLMVKTNAIHRNNDPNNPYPKSSNSSKWKFILRDVWFNKENYVGSGVIVIPSDPNALLERLDVLLASQEAGHTGAGNELVSICDELKRQGVLDTKTYKKLNSIIKNDST